MAMLNLVVQLDEQRRPTSEVDGWLSLAEGRIRGLGSDGDLEAHLLSTRSQVQRSRGDVEAALDSARAAVALRKRVNDPDDVAAMQASHELGAALISAGYPAEAKAILAEALDRATTTMPPEHWAMRGLGDALAVAELRVGDFEAAASRLRGLIAVAARVFGEEHEETAELRMKLIAALAMAGRPAEALPLLETVLASARRRFGEDSEDVGGLQINRAIMLSMLGRHAEAVPAGTEAVATLERALGAEHPQLIAPLTSLGGFLHASGDLRGAEAPVRRALAIAAKS